MSASFTTLRDAIGEEAAVALCEAAGGESLFVPKNFYGPDGLRTETKDRLVAIVGELAVANMIEIFPGENLYIPMARQEVAKVLYRQGCSVTVVSDRLGITKVHARRLRTRCRA